MHTRDWCGPTCDGEVRAGIPPHGMFIGPPPNLRGRIPAYELEKPVKQETLQSVRRRYETSQAASKIHFSIRVIRFFLYVGGRSIVSAFDATLITSGPQKFGTENIHPRLPFGRE